MAGDDRRRPLWWRKGILIPIGGVGLALAIFGAVAFACTGPGSEVAFATPMSGTHSASLSVSTYTTGDQFKPAGTTNFFFRYLAPGLKTSDQSCHHAATVGVAVSSNTAGNIGVSGFQLTRTITNLGSTIGTGEVCWAREDLITAYVSQPVVITVN